MSVSNDFRGFVLEPLAAWAREAQGVALRSKTARAPARAQKRARRQPVPGRKK